jgi:hypothetical protein
MAGIQNAVKVIVVRDAVATGNPITNAGNTTSSGVKMTAPNVSVDNSLSLVLRLFASRGDNNHGNPSEGTLLYGGVENQAQQTISASALTSVSTAATQIATMDQRSGPENASRTTTLVVEGANTSVTVAKLSGA